MVQTNNETTFEKVDNLGKTMYCVWYGGHMVGKLLVGDGINRRGAYKYISDFGIDKQYQGQGFGKALLQYTVNDLLPHRGIELSVWSTNYVARALYEKLGFKYVIPRYVRFPNIDDVDAQPLRMRYCGRNLSN
jgi:ribosomal protein S18 acetylase RimI-like enzyme